jgi:hypothetical protein
LVNNLIIDLKRAWFTNRALFLLLEYIGGNVELEKLKNYKINEHEVLSDTDKKHIANYQQLIKFFENALSNSIKEGKTDYNALHASCLQSIRFLDSLILTYDSSVQSARLINNTIDKIINDNKDTKKAGNE